MRSARWMSSGSKKRVFECWHHWLSSLPDTPPANPRPCPARPAGVSSPVRGIMVGAGLRLVLVDVPRAGRVRVHARDRAGAAAGRGVRPGSHSIAMAQWLQYQWMPVLPPRPQVRLLVHAFPRDRVGPAARLGIAAAQHPARTARVHHHDEPVALVAQQSCRRGAARPRSGRRASLRPSAPVFRAASSGPSWRSGRPRCSGASPGSSRARPPRPRSRRCTSAGPGPGDQHLVRVLELQAHLFEPVDRSVRVALGNALQAAIPRRRPIGYVSSMRAMPADADRAAASPAPARSTM